jgi:hypothetical protein
MIIKCLKCNQKLRVPHEKKKFDGDMVCPKCGRQESMESVNNRCINHIFDALMHATEPDRLDDVRKGKKTNDDLFGEFMDKLESTKEKK